MVALLFMVDSFTPFFGRLFELFYDEKNITLTSLFTG